MGGRNSSHDLSCWRANHVSDLIGDTGEGCTEGRRRNLVKVTRYNSLRQRHSAFGPCGPKHTYPCALNHEPNEEPSGCQASIRGRKNPNNYEDMITLKRNAAFTKQE